MASQKGRIPVSPPFLDLFIASSGQKSIRPVHFLTFLNPPIQNSNLPPARPHALLSHSFPRILHNNQLQHQISMIVLTLYNSFHIGYSAPTFSSTSSIPTSRPLPYSPNAHLPSNINDQILTLPANVPSFRPTRTSLPPTTAGNDIFHFLHSPFHQKN